MNMLNIQINVLFLNLDFMLKYKIIKLIDTYIDINVILIFKGN